MRRFLAIICLLVLLSGCGGLLDRDFHNIAPHLDQHAQTGAQIDGQASDLNELKRVLIQLIRQRGETMQIKLHNYTGDIKNDVSRAGSDIIREDPIGAYAVDYISPEYMPLGNEVSVSVFYKPDLPDDITYVSNMAGLTNTLEQALEKFEPRLVLEVGYFESVPGLDTLLLDAYYRLPERAVGMPVLTAALYPDSGLTRVVEMTLSYPAAKEILQWRASQAEFALNTLLRDMPDGLEPPFKALWLYNQLCAHVSYDTEARQREDDSTDANDNLYTALVEGRAVSAGYALAYQLLCGKAGIDCELVTGLRDNVPYVWNMICLDNEWYHVDAAADASAGGTHDWFLKTDEAMKTVARWTESAAHKCFSTQWNYDMLVLISTEEDADPALAGPPLDETDGDVAE